MESGGLRNARKPIAPASVRTGLGADAVATALIENLHCLQGKPPQHATRNDWYMALAYTVRDRMMERYVATLDSIARTNTDAKAVAYLSAEFLTGPHLGTGLINLGIWQAVEEALSQVGQVRDAVGHENFFLFGLTAEEVTRRKAEDYTPRNIYESNPELREAIDLIRSGFFSDGDRGLFQPLVDSLLTRDDYMLLADYQDYVECQERVSQAYADRNAWTRMSILNCARVGRFSSDRSIREYCRDIWKVTPIVFDERRAGCGP